MNVVARRNLGEQLRWRRGVEVEHSEGAPAGLVSAQRHRRNVHAVRAEERPDAANHAGTVGVFEHEHDAVRARFHRPVVDADDARGRAKESAGDGKRFAFRLRGEFDQSVNRQARSGAIGHLQAQSFGEGRGVDLVHVTATREVQKPCQHGARDASCRLR